MRKYVLIEREDDLALYLNSRGGMAGVAILTPSVFVGEELKRAGIPHEVMGRGRDCHEELMAMDKENGGKVIALRHDIADFLNEKQGYKFRGCHHPDCHLYATKGLIFSIQYRYHLLCKHLRLNANHINEDIEVYVYGDDHESDHVLSKQIDSSANFSLFTRENRSFSAVMRWAHKSIVKCPPLGSACDGVGTSSSEVSQGIRPIVSSILEPIFHRMFDIKNRIKCAGRDIALCDLCYLKWSDLYRANGQHIYKLAQNLEEASLICFKRRNRNGEIMDVVNSVEKCVLDVHAGRGAFDIHSFHFYPFIRNVLREFIYEEVASLYWADKRVKRIRKGGNIVSAHSDVPSYHSTYAIFQVLKRFYGVETFSYPHGAEGYYDLFWQERMTTSAPTFRIVRSEEQRNHFMIQQELFYQSRYHTSFKIKDLSYIDRRAYGVSSSPYYDILYALDISPGNKIYTVVNYPLDYDMYEKQTLIINCLVKIAARYGMSVCIRPKNNASYELDKYALNDLPSNVHVERRESFVNIVDRAKRVIMDSPGTALFESMEKGKKSMCIDIYCNDVSDHLKRIMSNKGVTYIAGKDFSCDHIDRMMEEFVRS